MVALGSVCPVMVIVSSLVIRSLIPDDVPDDDPVSELALLTAGFAGACVSIDQMPRSVLADSLSATSVAVILK